MAWRLSSDRASVRVRLRLEYLGTGFHGWQIQSGVRTVEGELTDALERLTGERRRISGASRTDAGVHARDQVAAFSYTGSLREVNFLRGLNTHLPDDVAVVKAEFVDADFEPRHNSLGKRYRFRFVDTWHLSPFEQNRAMHVRGRIDTAAMYQAAQALIGEHDFASFRGAQCDAQTTLRTLWRIDVGRHPETDVVELVVYGNAFLKYMVRNIAGTLLEVGLHRRAPDWVASVLAACDRQAAGRTAEPQGLCLERVYYADDPTLPSEAILRPKTKREPPIRSVSSE